MFKRLVSLVVVLSLVTGATLYAADAPAMQWHKGHGTDRGDHVHYGMQTSDGGYIMAGETSESGKYSDMLIVKTDAQGDLQWQKIIGTSRQPDFATFVTEVSEGFIVAGALAVSGDQERALVKLDTSGNIVWQKTYTHAGNGEIRGVDETGDGGLVATGYVGSGRSGYLFISDDGQGSILKTDANGNLEWEKTLSAAPHGMRVYEVAGGYTVSGVSREGNRNFCLIRTDNSGNIQWHKNYGGNEEEDLFDSDLAKDGGYILAGHKLIYGKVSNNTDVFDFWLVKVDSDGNMEWDKTFGQPRGYDANHIRDECYGVKATCDGGYIVVGGTGDEDSYSASGHPAGPSDIWKSYVVRTDGNGNLLWEGLYGDLDGNNAGEYINLTSDGGYIIFTDTDTAGSMGSNNFGLMKIAPDTLGDTTPPTPNPTKSKKQLPAQAPAMQWHKGHGTDNGDHVHYGMQTSDGGYIMAGETSESRRYSDMLIVKTDARGDLQWQKIIGTSRRADFATFVTEVSDGFIVAGALDVSGDQERALVKLDASGKIVWQKTYAHTGNDSIRGIDITSDGGIVATGYAGSGQKGYQFISDDGQGSILKTDADGNLQWEKTLSAAPHGMRVEEAAGGYAIGANVWVNSDGKNHQQVCLILTGSKGNEKFSETYGGDGDDQVFDFAVTTDGGYIFGGHSRSPSYGTVNWDFLLLKVGSDKKEQWHRTFGQPRGYDAKYIHDESYGVKQAPDGSYVVVGGTGDEYRYSESGHSGGRSDLWRAYVVKTDADGNLMWEGLYGELEGNNAGEYINLTSDGGYIIFTDSDTAGSMGSNNFGLMKIAPDAPPVTPPTPDIDGSRDVNFADDCEQVVRSVFKRSR